MKEIWKDIEGYEGLYQVSSHGRVKSLAREYYQSNGHGMVCHKIQDRILKNHIRRGGYLGVLLSKGKTKKTISIHRLVAQAFIPNPQNFPHINHKNEDKTDNSVKNLEWCTPMYNTHYGTRSARSVKAYRTTIGTIDRGVIQYDMQGNEIARYETCAIAGNKTGISKDSIFKICSGWPHHLTAGGYRWAFVEEDH